MYGFLKKSKAAVKDTMKIQETDETNPWGDSLETVLSQKSGRSAFRDFLKLEFCEENLEFWLACKEYRSFDCLEERTQIAASIYEEFIREGSPKQVNLDSYTRETIRQSLEEPGSSCFAMAERKIFILMENCSFPRFTETEPYKLFLNSISKQRDLKKKRMAMRIKSPVEDFKVNPLLLHQLRGGNKSAPFMLHLVRYCHPVAGAQYCSGVSQHPLRPTLVPPDYVTANRRAGLAPSGCIKTFALCKYLAAFSNTAMEPSENTTSNHAPNSTGAEGSWEISDKTRLCRFLCYGSEGEIYTAREQGRVATETAGALLSLLQEGRGAEAVEEAKRFAQGGRAVRPGPALFALALCSQHSELKTRQAAFKALREVCRDPAHLFSFVQYKKELKEGMKCGIWGRALRKAVSDWYNEQDPLSLAAAVTRCKQREGWSHQDLLRLSHTKPATEAVALISKYVTKGWKEVQAAYADKEKSEEVVKVLSYLEVVEKVKHSCDEVEVSGLIEEHKLEREQLLTDHLRSKQVWSALLKEISLHSILKILGKMTSNKLLEPRSAETQTICERLQNESSLKKANIHPFSILLASENYKRGQGFQGKTKWEADGSILKAMDWAFYTSFQNVEPVGKRFVVAVDVGTSLTSIVPGTAISTAVAAAAITMIFARTESNTQVLAFSEGAVVPCSLSADMSLAEVTAELVKFPSGSTDCTLPVTWATENGKSVDMFIILTNNPLWTFTASPLDSLKKHRHASGTDSKLVMCGLTSIGHAIADTEDRGLLSICGFDLGAFSVIRNLALDLI